MARGKNFFISGCNHPTEMEVSSFGRNFRHLLHWKLSKWQLPVEPVTEISSKLRHFRFSVGTTVEQIATNIHRFRVLKARITRCPKSGSSYVFTSHQTINQISYPNIEGSEFYIQCWIFKSSRIFFFFKWGTVNLHRNQKQSKTKEPHVHIQWIYTVSFAPGVKQVQVEGFWKRSKGFVKRGFIYKECRLSIHLLTAWLRTRRNYCVIEETLQ